MEKTTGAETDLSKLMRKNAFVEEKAEYGGKNNGKTPALDNPPNPMDLESSFAPKPVGIQTAPKMHFICQC